jgi:hypothetical protein
MKQRLRALEKKSAEEGIVFTEAQVQVLERKKHDDLAYGEIETHHPGYLGSHQVAFRRKLYRSLEELQTDLDAWLEHYNTGRTHQGKMCCGRTPMQALLDGKQIGKEKVGQLN